MAMPVVTTPVHVLNTPPRVISASADIRTEPTDMIFLRVNAVDADRDPLRLTYRWFRNGSELPSETEKALKLEHFQKGDEFTAEITVTDGEDIAPPYTTSAVKLGSHAPVITSEPPGAITEDRRYVYQVVVTGPEPESVSYELLDGPKGMKIDRSGLIDWQLPKREAGEREFEVVVKVSDTTGGEAFQQFTIAISAGPAQ